MSTKKRINVTLWMLTLPCIFVFSLSGFAAEKNGMHIAGENLFSDELDERDDFADDQDMGVDQDSVDSDNLKETPPPEPQKTQSASRQRWAESLASAEVGGQEGELDSKAHPVRQQTGQDTTTRPVQQKVNSSTAPRPVERKTGEGSGAKPVERNEGQGTPAKPVERTTDQSSAAKPVRSNVESSHKGTTK